jgi:hypothetical protein
MLFLYHYYYIMLQFIKHYNELIEIKLRTILNIKYNILCLFK